MDNKKIRLTLNLSHEMYEDLKREAIEQNESINGIMKQIIYKSESGITPFSTS